MVNKIPNSKITAIDQNKCPMKGLFMVFFVAAALSGLLLNFTGLLKRTELQTINQRFDARPWLKWSPESIALLSPVTIWQYHQAHEIPRTWWAWDYTLS